MSVEVEINEYNQFASLRSADGAARVVEVNGQHFLDGNFALDLLGQRSSAVALDAASGSAEVRPTGGARWQLVVLKAPLAMRFPQSTPFRAGGNGDPVLVAPAARVAPFKGRTWILLKDVAISTVSGVDPVNHPRSLVHPADMPGGIRAESLSEWLSPDMPKGGFPIVVEATGCWVKAGDRGSNSEFDHARQTAFIASARAELTFRISTARGQSSGLLRYRALAKRSLQITADAAAGLQLEGRSFGGAPGPLYATEACITGGMLSTGALEPDEVLATSVVGGRRVASLEGAASQFRYLVPLPPQGGSAPADAAQIVFIDGRVARDDDYSDHRQRFHGLAVEELATTRSAREILDCSAATVTLRNGAFHFEAGKPLTVIGEATPMPSLLVPKKQGSARTLRVPAGSMRLVVNELLPALVFDCSPAGGELQLASTTLRGPPVGSPAGDRKTQAIPASGAFEQTYQDWVLDRTDPFRLTIDAVGLRPAETDWATKFNSRAQKFALLEHPGTGLALKREQRLAGEPASTNEPEESGFATANVGGKEILVYTGFFAALSYARIECGSWEFGNCLKTDDIRFRFNTVKQDGTLQEFVLGRASNDLRVLFGGTPARRTGLISFIDRNVAPPKPGKETLAHWPFATGLSLLLRWDDTNGIPTYCDDIARARFGVEAMVGADFSRTDTLPVSQLYANATSWEDVARSAPELWPKAGSTTGTRSDPSDERWSGVFFRNMPLIIVPGEGVIEQVEKRYPALATLYKRLNESLLLEYGWHDEHGPTWLARLQTSNGAIDFTPSSWKQIVEFWLNKAESRGSQGATVGGGADLTIKLPCIKDDQQQPLTLEGSFDLDLTAQSIAPRVIIRSKQGFATTTRIPGFDAVKLAALSTDWVSTRFDLELVASGALVRAVPAFASSQTNPLKALLTLNFKEQVSARVDLVLPKTIKTTLFGKFPLTIEGMSLDLERSQAELTIACRVDLGLPGLQAWSLDLILTEKGAGFDLDVRLKEISGKMEFGEVSLSGKLQWIKEEFRGSLGLSGGVFGKEVTGVFTRSGVEGGRPFWLSAISAKELGLTAGAKIEAPVVLLSHAMDCGAGELYGALTNVSKPLTGLRPKGDVNQQWLDSWKFTPSVGTALAGSGYLMLDDRLAGSTKDQDDTSGKYLTNIVITDDGRVRADAWVNLFQNLPTRFVIAVDLKKKIMSAGVQLPAFKIPPKGDPQYEVSPGFISLTIGYGSETIVRYTVGWPTKVDGPGLERDWSQCTRVKINDMYPINTFWGGVLAEYSNKIGGFRFGVAVRAGWTKTYAAGGKGIAYAEAEVGITLGGVFVFAFYQTGNLTRLDDPPALSGVSKTATDLAEVISAATQELQSAMVPDLAVADFDACANAEIYGDIWGRGHAEFMGVTLASIDFNAYLRFQICGSIKAGITKSYAIAGFKVEVSIFCVTYRSYAETDISMIDGVCPSQCQDVRLAYERLPARLFPLEAS